jgi:hypothetical protein
VLINLTVLDFDQLLRLILRRTDREIPSGDRADLVDAFERMLLEQREKGKKVLLIIDEAQNLGAETLESIRLLLNLAQPGPQVLQLILVGQLSLVDVISRPDLRQLRQRIRVHYQLEPLARDELQEYVDHRLQVAGREKPLVTPKALDRVYELSGGVPRLVNHIVSKALLSGFVDGARRIEAKHVDAEGLLDLPVAEPPAPQATRREPAAAPATEPPPTGGGPATSPATPPPAPPTASPATPRFEAPAAPAEAPPPAPPLPSARFSENAGESPSPQSVRDLVSEPTEAGEGAATPPRRRHPWLAVVGVVVLLFAVALTAPLWGESVGLEVPWNMPFAAAVSGGGSDPVPPLGPSHPGPTTAGGDTLGDGAEESVPAGDGNRGELAEEPSDAPPTDEVAIAGSDGESADPEVGPSASEPVAGAGLAGADDEFAVHVASFALVERAERLERDLRSRGFSVFVKPKQLADEHVWYRVYLGPYDGRSAAEEAVSTLELDGLLTYYRVLSMQAT